MHHPTDRITHTTAFVTPVVEHWLERDQLLNACVTLHSDLVYTVLDLIVHDTLVALCVYYWCFDFFKIIVYYYYV